MFVCLFVCRGLVEGLSLLSGLGPASGELGISGTPSGIRELRPPVGTSADDPSQTGIKSALLEFGAGSSRDSAPLASVGARPATGMSTGSATSSLASRGPIVPASHRSGITSGRISIPEENCEPGIWHRVRQASVRAVTTHGIESAMSKVCLILFCDFWGSAGRERASAPAGYGLQARYAATTHSMCVVTNPLFPVP